MRNTSNTAIWTFIAWLPVVQIVLGSENETSWLQVFPEQTRTVAKLQDPAGRFGEARFIAEGSRIHAFWSEKKTQDADTYSLWHCSVESNPESHDKLRSPSRFGQSLYMDFEVVQGNHAAGVSWMETRGGVRACRFPFTQTKPTESCTDLPVEGRHPVFEPDQKHLLWVATYRAVSEEDILTDAGQRPPANAPGLPYLIHTRIHHGSQALLMAACDGDSAGNEPRVVLTDRELSRWTGDYKAFFEPNGDICVFAESSPCQQEQDQILQFRYESASARCRQVAAWNLTLGSWWVFSGNGPSYYVVIVDVPDPTVDPMEQLSCMYCVDTAQPERRALIWQPDSDGLEPANLHAGVFLQRPESPRGLLIWKGCNLRKLYCRTMVSKLSNGKWHTAPLQGVDGPVDILLVSESSGYIACSNDSELTLVPFRIAW